MKPRRRKNRHDQLTQTTLDDLWNDAVAWYKAGRLADAERLCRRMLSQQPRRPELLHLCGLLAFRQGRAAQGIARLRDSVAVQDDYAPGWKDLGNMLHEEQQLAEAEAAFRKLVELDPRDADAYNNLGVVLKDQGRLDEALAALRASLDLNPGSAAVLANLGRVLQRKQCWDQAVEAFRRVVQWEPNNADAHRRLVALLRTLARMDEARAAVQQWLAAEPDNAVAQHMSAALGVNDAPPQASEEYVRRVFDEAAGTFDQDLRSLGYRAPQWVAAAMVDVCGETRPVWDVLDAGCGTGLCGPYLRPFARRLTGVDLSAGMLARARALNLYDQLVAAELTTYLQQQDAAFDWIVSTDTLIYFGELGPVLSAAAGALRPEGHMLFTVEKDVGRTPPEPGYRLNPNGRYSHSEVFVRQRIATAGLVVKELITGILRQEADQNVVGFRILVSNCRTSSDSPATCH